MTSPLTPHALSSTELTAELKVITTCFVAMQPLDSNARERVIIWLERWMRAEKAPAEDY